MTKLSLWKSQLSNEKCFAKFESHLELLSKEFQEKFLDFSSFALFSAPFTFDVAKAEESLQMELLEMQSDSTLRAKYLEVGIPSFFLYLPERFTNFRRFATRIMAMFGSTCVCEQLFSFMKSTKTCHRTTLIDEHLSSLIKVGTVQAFQPDIPKIVMKKSHQA